MNTFGYNLKKKLKKERTVKRRQAENSQVHLQ